MNTDGMVGDARKRHEPSWALHHERQYRPMAAPLPPPPPTALDVLRLIHPDRWPFLAGDAHPA